MKNPEDRKNLEGKEGRKKLILKETQCKSFY